MKSKFAVPIIATILVVVSILAAVLVVAKAKTGKIRLNEGDVTISEVVVKGREVHVKVETSDSLGTKIDDNAYTYENGVLRFKLYGSKNVEIGKPYDMKQVVTVKFTLPGDVEKVYFMSVDDKGKETEKSQKFVRG